MKGKGKKVWAMLVALSMVLSLAGCAKMSDDQEGKGSRGESASHSDQVENTHYGVSDEALADAKEKGLLILVNKEHPISEEDKPDDLMPIKYYAEDRSKQGRFMRAEAAEQFHKLSEAAAAEGYKIVVTTAYRSYDFQKTLYDNYVAAQGQEAADTFSARPGTSEHQTGLAADVSSPSVDYQLSEKYGDTPEGKWLADNAHRFGFIIRYPKDKEDITGYIYEPWHIRYVGQAVAEAIYKNKITLEEFLQEVQ